MRPRRYAIVAVSLGQIGLGLVCLFRAHDDDVGRFGLACCVAVGGLGLITQATAFLRPVGIVANVLMALVFLPGLLGGIIALIDPVAGPGPGVWQVLLVASIVAGSAFNANALWKLYRASQGARPVATGSREER